MRGASEPNEVPSGEPGGLGFYKSNKQRRGDKNDPVGLCRRALGVIGLSGVVGMKVVAVQVEAGSVERKVAGPEKTPRNL